MTPRLEEFNQKVEQKANRLAAMKFARSVLDNFNSYSQIKHLSEEESLPCFEREEIHIGELLGKGGFNQVFAIDRIDLMKASGQYSHKMNFKAQQNRRKICKGASRGQYAMKFLKSEVMDDPEAYGNGAADLMIETKILSGIRPHPNVITLHGAAGSGLSGFATGTEAYFIILDRLTDTLFDRIESWKKSKQNSMFERIKVGFDLASALAHLHSHSVIFRDLKPDNVGFDAQGVLKLFDFGLAKEIDPRLEVAEDTYQMSGNTGSLRYMSPEVFLCKPYGLSSDVYSFGVVLWEICALEEPYNGMTQRQHTEQVIKGDVRPDLNDEWSERLNNVLKWSWIEDQSIRPPVAEIRRALKSELRSHSPQMDLPENPLDYHRIEKVSPHVNKQRTPPAFTTLSAIQAACSQYRRMAPMVSISTFDDLEFTHDIDLHTILEDALEVTEFFDE